MTTRRENLKDIKAGDCPFANAGLWLDKFFCDHDTTSKDDQKRVLVNQVSSIEAPDIYGKFFTDRWSETLKLYGAKCREVKVSGRMAVGLGADSVLETSITLHRTYGVPYIPASALKGLALRYARKHLEKKGGDGEWTKEHTNKLFGKTDEAGYITFFDALYVPDSGRKVRVNNQEIFLPLAPDVITVHHPKYYQSGDGQVEPPADWDDPTPIPFLSATGKYLLAVAAPDALEWREVTLAILEKALAEEGIGAKTSSGYGRMSVPGS